MFHDVTFRNQLAEGHALRPRKTVSTLLHTHNTMSEDSGESCFLSSRHAVRALGVDATTLRRWRLAGTIRAVKTSDAPNANHLYDVSRFYAACSEGQGQGAGTGTGGGPAGPAGPARAATTPRRGIIYARVSSAKQKPDLERQKQLLRDRYPDYELFSDVASGINFRRPGLQTLLVRVVGGGVSEVVAASRDRLCRFAFDLVESVLKLHGTRITILVLADAELGSEAAAPGSQRSFEQELAEDLLAINTVFIARMQGRRAAAFRRERSRRNQGEGRPEAEEAQAPDSLLQDADQALGEEDGEFDSNHSHPGVPELCPEGHSASVARRRSARVQPGGCGLP